MPELPEVETVARQLKPHIEGRRVRGLRILDPRLRRGRTPALAGRQIAEVGRSGKRVLIEFGASKDKSSPLWLAVHLRMTGRLIWSPAGTSHETNHLRARIDLDRGRILFLDTRRFGTFDWYRERRHAEPPGVDPLAPELTRARLADLIEGSTQNLKAWLLRQDRLVGLGNIYASEILHEAELSPFRSGGSLESAEVGRLYRATRKILRRAIRNCGTTFSDFRDAHGVQGSYQQYLAVYERVDQTCNRCSDRICRIVQQQRSTYYCPGCQV